MNAATTGLEETHSIGTAPVADSVSISHSPMNHAIVSVIGRILMKLNRRVGTEDFLEPASGMERSSERTLLACTSTYISPHERKYDLTHCK